MQQRVDLPAAGAGLVERKQLLRVLAAGERVHIGIGLQVVIGEYAAAPVQADIRQLLVLVGILMKCLLDQLAGDDPLRPTVIPAVDIDDLRNARVLDHQPVVNIPGGAPERVRQRGAADGLIGEVHGITEPGQHLAVN